MQNLHIFGKEAGGYQNARCSEYEDIAPYYLAGRESPVIVSPQNNGFALFKASDDIATHGLLHFYRFDKVQSYNFIHYTTLLLNKIFPTLLTSLHIITYNTLP